VWVAKWAHRVLFTFFSYYFLVYEGFSMSLKFILFLFLYFMFKMSYLIKLQASEGAFVRKSAASMLTGKRPVQAAVSFSACSCFLLLNLLCITMCFLIDLLGFFSACYKKGGLYKIRC
jgi:hypothetical protein